jgi:hypothetical protein
MLKKLTNWIIKNLIPISVVLGILASLWIILGIKPVLQWEWRTMSHKLLGGNDLLVAILAIYAIINAFQVVKINEKLKNLYPVINDILHLLSLGGKMKESDFRNPSRALEVLNKYIADIASLKAAEKYLEIKELAVKMGKMKNGQWEE